MALKFSDIKQWLTLYFQRERPESSAFQETYDKIEQIDPSWFKMIYRPRFAFVSVDVYQDNIESYLNFLNMILNGLEKNTLLDAQSFNKAPKSVFIHEFYLDTQGNYLDAIEKTAQLKEAIKQFIHLYEQLEGDLQTPFPNKRNLHLVVKTVRQSQDLIRVLWQLQQ